MRAQPVNKRRMDASTALAVVGLAGLVLCYSWTIVGLWQVARLQVPYILGRMAY